MDTVNVESNDHYEKTKFLSNTYQSLSIPSHATNKVTELIILM